MHGHPAFQKFIVAFIGLIVIGLLTACGAAPAEPSAALVPTANVISAPQPEGPLQVSDLPFSTAEPAAQAAGAQPLSSTPATAAATPVALPSAAATGGPASVWDMMPTGGIPSGAGLSPGGTTQPSAQPNGSVASAPTTTAPGAPAALVPLSATSGSLPAAQPTSGSQSSPVPVVRDGPGGLPYPLSLTKLNFGVVGHLYYTDRGTALAKAREAGFTWFRQQIHWRDIEDRSGQFFWDDLDNIVADVHASGMLLMLNITRSPSWYTANGSDGLPQDPASLARFTGALAERYRGRVHAILIWNEQNLAYENGGQIGAGDPGHFAEIMAASYNAIKAADPSIIVAAGAPASTATNNPAVAMDTLSYLRAMYSYKNGMIRDYFDVQALHPGGSANPPETLWPANPSTAQGWTDDASFYFRHVENQRRVMEESGMGDHQVWITEYGWATPNSTPGYEFGNQISYETQRDYIVGAIWYTYKNYPWVSNMFLWNLNFTVLQAESGKDPQNEQGSFSIVNADWSPRPAFYGIQQAIADIRAQQ